MAAGQCSPIRGVFAGAGARWGCCPPPRGCSQEDKLRIRAQLRLGSGNRRTADCWNRTSVEKGTHRRKAPVPVRVCFVGADARWRSCPPTSHRSTEDRVRIRALLRLGSSNRRKMNTEEPNSVERGAHRRKAPAPVSGCFAGGEASAKRSPTASSCSSDERMRICAQLRPVLGNRRTLDHRHRTSCEAAGTGGCHLQTAVSPAKGYVVGSR